ncbi:MAG: FtsX-like permease family protein [Acidimicrobiia bacterium]
MGAVWMCVRSELRRRWRYVAVLTLVIGVTGTVVLTATAEARRTSTSFDRFVESTRAYDVLVFFNTLGPSAVPELRRLPGVETIGVVRVLAVTFGDGRFIPAGGPLDDVVLHDVARPRIIAGRPTAPDAPEEIVVGEPLARQRGLVPGDSFVLRGYTPEQIVALAGPVGSTIPEPAGPAIRMRVVGISRLPTDLSQQGEAGGILLTSRAFVEKYGDQIGEYLDAVILVRLTDGAEGVPRFVRQLRENVGEDTAIDEVEPTAVSTSGVRESIDVMAIGLVVFAAIAMIAGLTAVGFATARLVALGVDQRETWHALGLTRTQRAFVLAAPALVATGAGAFIALVGAWLTSGRMPLGLAREAEPSPGMQFDTLVLAGGVVAIVIVLCGIAVLFAWRQASRGAASATRRMSVIGGMLEAGGAAPPIAIGVRAALERRRGRAAIPVRSTLAAAAIAVLGIVAVSVFASSLDRLAHTPPLYGFGWDVGVDDSRAERPVPDRPCSGLSGTRVSEDAAVEAIAGVCLLNVEIEGHPLGALGFSPVRGSILPTVIEGRAPRARDEVALGSATFDIVERAIGDRVRAEGPAGTASYRVVGRVAVPTLGDATSSLADGAIFTGAGLDRLDEPAAELSHGWVVARLAAGVDHAAAARRLARLPDLGDPEASGVDPVRVPLEVRRLQQVNDLPLALAGFLALLGATAIGYALVTSIRRRRSELAVLKTLGFSRRQLVATVVWQATTVACVGIVVGIPVGIVVGRLVWRAVANSTGVAFSPDVPIVLVLAVAVAALVFANLVASLPARASARVSPATALRTE